MLSRRFESTNIEFFLGKSALYFTYIPMVNTILSVSDFRGVHSRHCTELYKGIQSVQTCSPNFLISAAWAVPGGFPVPGSLLTSYNLYHLKTQFRRSALRLYSATVDAKDDIVCVYYLYFISCRPHFLQRCRRQCFVMICAWKS